MILTKKVSHFPSVNLEMVCFVKRIGSQWTLNIFLLVVTGLGLRLLGLPTRI